MTTLTITRPRSRLPWLALLLAACALAWFVLPALNGHALERHGAAAIAVWDQLCSSGPEATFRHDNRTIYCTKLSDGKYGAVVTEDCQGIECLVTSFKSKYERLADITRYLLRTGAVPVK